MTERDNRPVNQPSPYSPSFPPPPPSGSPAWGSTGQPPQPRRRFRKGIRAAVAGAALFAVTAAVAVVVVATRDAGADRASAPAEEPPAQWQPTGPADPRRNPSSEMRPVVADDWQVVISPRGTMAWDVPPEWNVHEVGSNTFWPADDPEEEGSEHAYTLRDPAHHSPEACTDQRVAYVGTRYVQGATDTEEAVRSVSSNLAWAVFDQGLEGDLTTTEAEPFENEHGVVGHIAYSTSSGAPLRREGECATTEGRALSVSFINATSDIVAWGLVADTGHEHAVSEETVDLIVSSIRPYDAG
ncbi:hypothetical protein [Streptomyces ginkgonis]|uniref:hypothetical protein n=1 Tax=Streptomyces ginkgonis TaxID=1812259 RepID=UPI002176CFB7|nr:hypothetical protein [Streptomyces ginkgonis]